MSRSVTVTYRVCNEDSAGNHYRGMPLPEDHARRELTRMRAGSQQPGRWHAHRVEVITKDEQVDWT